MIGIIKCSLLRLASVGTYINYIFVYAFSQLASSFVVVFFVLLENVI